MVDKNEVQPDIQPPLEKPKNNNLLLVLFIILFFLASGIAVYAIYQNKQLQKQITQLKFQANQKTSVPAKVTPTPSLTENWKTYSNKQYNLSFKYPSNFIIEENVIPTNNSLQIIINKGQKNTFSVKASANFSSTDATYFLDAEPTGEVIIGGITWKNYYLPTGSSHGTEPIYGLQNQTNEVLYTVTFFNQNSINPIQNQILSTFKFINQQQEISTENWKTYSCEKFSFKYPSEFFLEERQPNYLVLLSNENNPQSTAIAIDARLIGNYVNYNQAISSTKEGLTNVETQDLSNGIKIKGIIKSGPEQGQEIIIALLKYQQGAIEVETLSPEPTQEKIFDQLILSLELPDN